MSTNRCCSGGGIGTKEILLDQGVAKLLIWSSGKTPTEDL